MATYKQMATMIRGHAEAGNAESCRSMIGHLDRAGKNVRRIIEIAIADAPPATAALLLAALVVEGS